MLGNGRSDEFAMIITVQGVNVQGFITGGALFHRSSFERQSSCLHSQATVLLKSGRSDKICNANDIKAPWEAQSQRGD